MKGEPAFPTNWLYNNNTDPGLTKRELFAAMAMQGILSDSNTLRIAVETAKDNKIKPEQEIANRSTDIADALLEELSKEED